MDLRKIVRVAAGRWAHQVGKVSGNEVELLVEEVSRALEAAEHPPQSDVCHTCDGTGERLWNDGLMHICSFCNGSGKRR